MDWTLPSLLLGILFIHANPGTCFVDIPQRAFSVAPGIVEYGQKARFYVFSTDPATVSYRTRNIFGPALVASSITNYTSTASGDIHITTVDYEYTLPAKANSSRDAAVELRVDLCYRQDACAPEDTLLLEHKIQIAPGNRIILIETNKPEYFANETVFAYIGFVKPNSWTMVGVTENNANLMEVKIRSSYGEIKRTWKGISVTEASSMSFLIPKDATPGEWKIEVTLNDETVYSTFQVTGKIKQTSPLVSFRAPKYIGPNSKNVEIEVCAKLEDGAIATGYVKLQLCSCTFVIDDILRTESCVHDRGDQMPRPCIVANGVFDDNGCGQFNMSLHSPNLDPTDAGTGKEKLFICTQFTDSRSSKIQSYCEGDVIQYEDTQPIFLRSDLSYKYALPTYVRLDVRETGLIGTNVSVEVYQELGDCTWKSNQTVLHTPRIMKSLTSTVTSEGVAIFMIPPLLSTQPLRISASMNVISLGEKILLTGGGLLTPWYSKSGEAIQVWPHMDKAMIQCNDVATIDLVGNVPLSKKRMYVYVYARAVVHSLETITEPLMDNCRNEDGPLGHFTCPINNSHFIQCLPGWTGDGCLDAICASACDPVGGYCNRPGECLCRPGWMGNLCEICTYCGYRSECVSGNECSCPWYNRTCTPVGVSDFPSDNKPATVEHMRPVKLEGAGTQRRLIYYARISIKALEVIRDEMTVTIFYVNRLDDGTIETVSTNIKLVRHTECVETEPKFSTHYIEETRTMMVVIRPQRHEENIENLCHVNVWSEDEVSYYLPKNLIDSKDIRNLFDNYDSKYNTLGPGGSGLDFWRAGLSKGATIPHKSPEISEKCFLNQQRRPGAIRKLPIRSTSVETVFFKTAQVHTEHTLNYAVSLPYRSGSWKASVHCYGPGVSFLAATSEPITVTFPRITSTLEAPENMNFLELAEIAVVVNAHALHGYMTCSMITVEFFLKDWYLAGPTIRKKCECGITETRVATWGYPRYPYRLKATVELTIKFNARECVGPGHHAPEYTARRKMSQFTQVSIDGTDAVQASFLSCSDSKLNKVQTEKLKIKLPKLPNNTAVRKLVGYLTYSADVVGPILQNMLTSSIPLMTASDHLSTMFVAFHTISYVERHLQENAYRFQPLSTKAFQLVQASSSALFNYICENGLIALHAGSCDVPDPWLQSIVYRTLMHIQGMGHTRMFKEIYHDNHQRSTEVKKYLDRLLDADGCYRHQPNGDEENALKFTAHVYLSRRTSGFAWDNHTVLSSVAHCLVNKVKKLDNDISTYRNDSLAQLAYAFALIDPKLPETDRLMQLVEQRMVNGTSLTTGQPEAYWSVDNGEAVQSLEATANAYFALIHTGASAQQLVPVIRWIVSQQTVTGWFATASSTIPGTSVLFDYSNRIRLQVHQKLVPIRLMINNSESNFHLFTQLSGANRRLGVERCLGFTSRIMKELDFHITDIKGIGCVVGRLMYIYRTTEPVIFRERQDSNLITVSPSSRSTCNRTELTLCTDRRQFNDSIFISVSMQRGWDVGETEKNELLTSQHGQTAVKHISFNRTNEFQVTLNNCSVNETDCRWCANLTYRWRLDVKQSKPATIWTVVRNNDHEQRQRSDVALPRCVEKIQSITRKITFNEIGRKIALCPLCMRVAEEEAQVIQGELYRLCEKTIHFFHVNYMTSTGTRSVEVYELKDPRMISAWPSALPENSRYCINLHGGKVYLFLDRTPYKLIPGDPVLTLDSQGQQRPVVLLEMDRTEDGMLSVLRNMSLSCQQIDTLSQIVYNELL